MGSFGRLCAFSALYKTGISIWIFFSNSLFRTGAFVGFVGFDVACFGWNLALRLIVSVGFTECLCLGDFGDFNAFGDALDGRWRRFDGMLIHFLFLTVFVDFGMEAVGRSAML